ncbi:MAG: hypothetical protein QJR08_03775 [Bacillota bacterium]|nr:hypothetical protein [Bacillota bacterium]
MARRAARTDEWQASRLVDMSGGLNTLVAPNLLNDNESPLSENVDRSLKGTIRPCLGRRARYAAPFDSSGGVAGLLAFHRSDGTARLLAGVGGRLYVDLPHLVLVYDTQSDWQRGTVAGSASTTASAGDVTLAPTKVQDSATADFTKGTGDAGIDAAASVVALKANSGGTTVNDQPGWAVATYANFACVGSDLTLNLPLWVTGVWFKPPTSGQSCALRIYDASGALVASGGAISTTTANAWTLLPLASAVRLHAQTYRVCVYTSAGTYGADYTGSNNVTARTVFAATVTYGTTVYSASTDVFPTATGVSNATLILGLQVQQQYATSGTWTSPVIDTALEIASASVSVTATTPTGTSIAVKARTSADNVTWGAWQTLGATGGAITSPQRYIEIQVALSTTDTTKTPTVTGISVTAKELVRGTWTSDVIDVSTAQDPASGNLAVDADTSMGGTVSWQSRSSSDGVTWSAWTAVNADGSLASPANTRVQLRATLSADVQQASYPLIHKATLAFDATPAMSLLASDFTPGGVYRGATLAGLLSICNGIDAPRTYDGTTLSAMGGNPPVFVVAGVHKNRLWVAAGSALFFSDYLDVNTWPVLNYIYISKDDGDEITGLLPYADMLVVTKRHSVWAVTGDDLDNFAVVRIHSDVGCVAPDSLVVVNNLVAFVSDSGVWFTDLNTPVLATQRLQANWDSLNHRRLDTAAAGFDAAHSMLYVALPSRSASVPDHVWAFDVLRNAWDIRPTWAVSSFATFREAGADVFLMGDSARGQVYSPDSVLDDGAAVPYAWESKPFDFGLPEWTKFLRRVIVQARADGADGQLQLAFRTDEGPLSAWLTQTVPNDGSVKSLHFYPGQAGAQVTGRRFSVRIGEGRPGARTQVHSITFEWKPLGVRPSVVA